MIYFCFLFFVFGFFCKFMLISKLYLLYFFMFLYTGFKWIFPWLRLHPITPSMVAEPLYSLPGNNTNIIGLNKIRHCPMRDYSCLRNWSLPTCVLPTEWVKVKSMHMVEFVVQGKVYLVGPWHMWIFGGWQWAWRWGLDKPDKFGHAPWRYGRPAKILSRSIFTVGVDDHRSLIYILGAGLFIPVWEYVEEGRAFIR